MSDSQTRFDFSLPDEAATARLGAALAQALGARHEAIAAQGFVIGLTGDLGAGKTALVRATLRAMGVEGSVKSPTFALVELYAVSRLNFYHFDFYRFNDPREFATAGFREMFGAGSICAIEWIERAVGVPGPDLALTLTVVDPGRRLAACAKSELGVACLKTVIEHWSMAGGAG